jgi:hypothetical protein
MRTEFATLLITSERTRLSRQPFRANNNAFQPLFPLTCILSRQA